ncbi:MAG TPA: outer membrane beta-barrel domain-containing protein [Polyangiaceae bacterium]|jgi:outer membrane beta-barrel protein|nr:outer membrane beta-barrel domain-containing protein [Polyangiaceae bacterium]
MMQARRWLLLAAALVLTPHAAYAQKKKPPKAGAAPAPAPAAPAPAPVNVDADADQPSAQPGAPPAGGDQKSTPESASPSAAGDTAGAVDICQITPDAPQCQLAKEVNLATEAKKPIRAEIYAVQQQYVIKARRLEIMPYFAITLNDQFVSHNAPGLSLNYYVTQVLAVGITGNWYQGLNADSDFNFQNRRAARIAVPLNEYQVSGDFNFTYVPMYGKFAGFGDFIFHYDAYIDGGVGLIRTRPIPVIDPDNRKFDWNNLINFDVGIGLRIFFNRWVAATLEIRDIMYFEKIESITIPAGAAVTAGNPGYGNSPLNPDNWYDKDTHFTNDVQMQVGLSFLLPTSFEYRLPK